MSAERDQRLKAKAAELAQRIESLLGFLEDDSQQDMKTDARLRIEYLECLQSTQQTVDELKRIMS